MRYLAQRVGTGEWITRDLPLTEVQRTRDLSGPGGITATIDPELRVSLHSDGRRILDPWGTIIYAAEDNGRIRSAGIFEDASYEESALRASCPGFCRYPHGYIYDTERNWGPNLTNPALNRPDPLQIVQDHWAWIQAQQSSNLGVTLVGNLTSTERVGSYEEPYRLQSWEIPDLGDEIDSLAASTPFDYVEEHEWANAEKTAVNHRVRLGWPRLGTRREDLRFAIGENITQTVPAATTGAAFANDVIGIGNGEGRTMVRSRSTVVDGRLRRTRVVTDKTLYKAALDKLVLNIRERASDSLDITSVAISDHPNARLTEINLGDDIYLQTYIPSYGDVRIWVRVLSITEDEAGDNAVLTTQRSSAFIYSSTVDVSG